MTAQMPDEEKPSEVREKWLPSDELRKALNAGKLIAHQPYSLGGLIPGASGASPSTGPSSPSPTGVFSQNQNLRAALKYFTQRYQVNSRNISKEVITKMDSIPSWAKPRIDWISKMIDPPLYDLDIHWRFRSPVEALKHMRDINFPGANSIEIKNYSMKSVASDLGSNAYVLRVGSGPKFVIQELEMSAFTKEYIYPFYVDLDSVKIQDNDGYLANEAVPVYRVLVEEDERAAAVDWKRTTEAVLAVLMHTEAYFDMPLLTRQDRAGKVEEIRTARLRAKYDEKNYTVDLLALTFCDMTEQVTYKDGYTLPPKTTRFLVTLNIGQFPEEFQVTADQLEQGFVSSLDSIVDLEVGANLRCVDCETEYSILDPMSLDRLSMALTEKCWSCLEHKPDKNMFQSATPMPW